MTYRVAKSLLTLLAQVDAAWPQRSKASDGTVGDAAHVAEGSASDHNPWLKDSAGIGVVRALDVTHDPAHGCDTYALADRLRLAQDRRVTNGGYIISNRRITGAQHGWEWAPYNGSDPHANHMHVSVSVAQKLYDDTSAWAGIEEDTMTVDVHALWAGSLEIPDMRDQSKADVTPATALAQVWDVALKTEAAVAALGPAAPAGPPAPLSDADVARIATATADLLYARLKS